MNLENRYKYEVAFSFLQEDEPLASRLNDLLQERMSSFIYTERQLELAGKDGESTLKKVFGSDARIVVILFRKAWGTTPWTRIEQDAIRNRAYEHGYDFCLLVPLDEVAGVPEWYPKNRIWLGLKRYGEESMAAVIEARIEEAGGATRDETLTDRKERLQRNILRAQKRRAFLSSEGAVQVAYEEAERVFKSIEGLIPSLTSAEIPLFTKRDREGLRIISDSLSVFVYWHRAYTNTLEGSALFLKLVQTITHRVPYKTEHREISSTELRFDVSEPESYGWTQHGQDNKFFTTRDVAQLATRIILDAAASYHLNRLR